MDLHGFRLVRSPRAVGEGNDPALIIGPLTDDLEVRLAGGADKEAEREARTMAEDWVEQNDDPMEWLRQGSDPNTAARQVLAWCGQADRWLLDRSDVPTGNEFRHFRADLLRLVEAAGDEEARPEQPRPAGFAQARPLLCDAIAAEYLLGNDLDRLQLLCRALLVMDILDPLGLPQEQLANDEPGQPVWNRLHRRTIVLASAVCSSMRSPRVELVRAAKVSDLFVVRSEWSCYRAGEVANIVNVLAGESFRQRTKRTEEEETITDKSTDTLQSTEKTEEDRTQTELSREMERAASASVSAEGSFNVSGQYGVTQFGASGGASASASLSESSRTASKVSRDLVSKAVAKVESRIREERRDRRLTRVQDLLEHIIDNREHPHQRGVLRWVDRVDRYQVFRFPDRLLLEFEMPEPAEYFRWRMTNRQSTDATAVGQPPAFDVVARQIGRDDYTDQAARFHASNVPPPPDALIGVTSTTASESALEPEDGKSLWAKPFIHKEADVTIPSGYVASSISFSGEAIPFFGKWETEKDGRPPVNNTEPIEGYHGIVVSVCGGADSVKIVAGSPNDPFKDFSVQIEGDALEFNRTKRHFGKAFLQFNQQNVALGRYVKDKVSYAISCTGAKSVSLSVLVNCELSRSAYEEWQNAVYDILFDAWQNWQQQYRTQELQRGAGNLTGFNATSPSRNKEIIIEELKRQTISWLLNDEAFQGRDAMQPQGDSWARMNLDGARDAAPMIQFLEQAFEWSNLTYMLYPYYWARGGQWDGLADIEATDPDFAKFLRCGSARVIVPARPGFEEAVKHWLLYQEPFLGGPLPSPGDPMYLSLAREIEDLTRGPDDGEPQDCWEARIGTPLLWLDPSPDLPHNDARQLGLPPHEPTDPICDD